MDWRLSCTRCSHFFKIHLHFQVRYFECYYIFHSFCLLNLRKTITQYLIDPLIFFRLSNFAVINDGVLAVAINLSIALLVFWTLIVKRFAIGELPMNYYICLGIDPNKDKGAEYYQSAPKKYNASLILWIFCTLLHIFMWPKIFLYRRKAEKNTEPIELGSFNQDSEKKQNSRRRRHYTQSNSPLR